MAGGVNEDAAVFVGDNILAVDGFSNDGRSSQEVLDRIAGPPGSSVLLMLQAVRMQHARECGLLDNAPSDARVSS